MSTSGYEWVVEAQGCYPDSLTNVAKLQGLFRDLIAELDLHAIGEPLWHVFPSPHGVTGMCLLSESHLTVHTFPEHGSLCLNLFCCRKRDEWDFDAQLRHRFGANAIEVRLLERNYAAATQSVIRG